MATTKPLKNKTEASDQTLGTAGAGIGGLISIVFVLLAGMSILDGAAKAMFYGFFAEIVAKPICALIWKAGVSSGAAVSAPDAH
jgi:hypothetical protein